MRTKLCSLTSIVHDSKRWTNILVHDSDSTVCKVAVAEGLDFMLLCTFISAYIFSSFTQIHGVPTVVQLQSLEKLHIHVFFDKSYGNFSKIHSKIHSLIYLFKEE